MIELSVPWPISAMRFPTGASVIFLNATGCPPHQSANTRPAGQTSFGPTWHHAPNLGRTCVERHFTPEAKSLSLDLGVREVAAPRENISANRGVGKRRPARGV